MTERRRFGSGSISVAQTGGFEARIYLRDGRRVAWRRPTYEDAEAALREMVELHKDEVPASYHRYYIAYKREPRRQRPPRSGVTVRVRWLVLERDGHRCVYCGSDATEAKLVIDHIVPVADGGTDAIDNLATACRECNAGKSSLRLVG